MSHWLTTHSPPVFSAIRASPLSSAAIAASTACRTSPLVSVPSESRSSQAWSMTVCRSFIHSFSKIVSSHSPTSVDAKVDDGFVIAVIAALGAIVDPHRGHAELLRGREVLDHVLDHAAPASDRCRTGRAACDSRAARAWASGRLAKMSCRSSNCAAMPRRVEHPPGISRIAVGEDELAARQARAARRPAGRRARAGRAGCRGRRPGNGAGRRRDPSSGRRASCRCSWKCAFWTRRASTGSQPSSRWI